MARGIEDIFEFFSDAHNLERITPRGIPARWDSEITAWEPPFRFVDEQRGGPFRRWVHEHIFLARQEQTIARDDVCYAVPGGRGLHDLFVRKDLERLFSYRHAQLTRILGDHR